MKEKNRITANYAYDLLKEMIFDWRLTPGQKINISQLSKELKVSSVPLREALSRLYDTKLVSFSPNRGYKVSEILNDDEMNHLLDARILFEQQAIIQIIRDGSLEVIEKLNNLTKEMTNLKVKNSHKNILEFVHLDQEFHLTLLKTTHNIFLIEAYKSMYSHFHIARFYRIRGSIDQDEATAEHYKIIDAIKKRDIYQGETAVIQHLKDAKSRLLEK